MLCVELLLPKLNQESPELLDPLLLVELADPELVELFAFTVALFEPVPLVLELGFTPVDDPEVDELLPNSDDLFDPVPLELWLGFDPADPMNDDAPPLDPGLFDPDPVEKRDELKEAVPVDAGLLSVDADELKLEVNPVLLG